MHLRNACVSPERLSRLQRWLRFGQITAIAFTSIGFLTYTIAAIATSQMPKNRGMPFYTEYVINAKILAYLFLILFILMATANTALMLQIRAMNRKNSGTATYIFRKEKCTLAIILIFFGLSYLFRFVWDEFLLDLLFEHDFICEFAYDLVSYFDGLSFAALLLFHKSNFKVHQQVQENEHANMHLATSMNDNGGSVVYLEERTNISSSQANTDAASAK